MKKLHFIITLMGLGILMIVPGAHAQMMGHGYGSGQGNSMHNGNYQNHSYMTQMSNMMGIEDSLDAQIEDIIVKYDNLQSSYDELMKISDMQKLKDALRERHDEMVSLRNELSRFEKMHSNLYMMMNAQAVYHSMHNMMYGMLGLDRTHHEDR